MATIPQNHDDCKLSDHWIWMLGPPVDDGTDTQPDGERWTIATPPLSPGARVAITPAPPPKFHEPTDEDISWLAQFDFERCEERTALLTRYPLNYEPADIEDDEEFAVTGDDLEYQHGFSCGYDGHLANPPSGLTDSESDAWKDGWTEGYYAYINELERDYVLGHPDPDPDPWNEAHSPLAGHPSDGE